MKSEQEKSITHSIKVLQDDIYVSIGYISKFIGICSARLHTILKDSECIYQGKRKLYPFARTILYLMENNVFRYSKYLTKNGKKIREIQRIKK